jgi:putative N6-adenine-specific DNA methylase
MLPVGPNHNSGCYHTSGSLWAARHNPADAGCADAVRLKQADVLKLAPPADRGVMVANPPYGVRLGEQAKLAEFYPRLGDALKRSFGGWTCCILSADPRLARLIHLKPSRRIPLFNGALECRLLEYRMVAAGPPR